MSIHKLGIFPVVLEKADFNVYHNIGKIPRFQTDNLLTIRILIERVQDMSIQI